MKRSSPTLICLDPNGDVHFEIDGRRRLVPSPTHRRRPCAAAGRRRDVFVIGASSRVASKRKDAVPPGSRENALFHIKRARGDGAVYADKRLERFFRSINDIASGYLGEAQLSGYKVVHIDRPCVKSTGLLEAWGVKGEEPRLISTRRRLRETTPSRTWRASGTTTARNRLKAFVFLHDVDCDEKPPGAKWPSGLAGCNARRGGRDGRVTVFK